MLLRSAKREEWGWNVRDDEGRREFILFLKLVLIVSF
jgi:hypothetical protein